MTQIVVGVDGSESSERALAWAADEARLRGVRLRVVHAWFEIFVAPYFAEPAVVAHEACEQEGQEILEKAVASIPDGSPAMPVDAVLVHGRPEDVLLAESDDADMLVVGSRGRGGFAGLLMGSVSQHVVHQARCPVVVVR